MGYGDHLISIGAASRQHRLDAQRRPVAIGNGRQVDPTFPELRHGLDFLATQAMVDAGEPVSWLISYEGYRPYHDHAAMAAEWSALHPWRRLFGAPPANKLSSRLGRCICDPQHRAEPAPLVLDAREEAVAREWSRQPFVVIEPHIKGKAPPSKRWPFERFAAVARSLRQEIAVFQAGEPDLPALEGVPRLPTKRFRDVLSYLKAARLYIGPEGGLHHAAAAMGTPAVVLFGGYISPKVTGYDFHANLTGGAEACGTRHVLCAHCVAAMGRISVEEVLGEARRLLARPQSTGAAAARSSQDASGAQAPVQERSREQRVAALEGTGLDAVAAVPLDFPRHVVDGVGER